MALTTNPPLASLARVISSLSCLSRADAVLIRSVMLGQSRKSYFPGAAYGDITSLPAQPDTKAATHIAASLRPLRWAISDPQQIRVPVRVCSATNLCQLFRQDA